MRYPKYKLLNFTGHVVNDAMAKITYPAENSFVARCNWDMVPVGQSEEGSIIYQSVFKGISGLPDPVEGVKYIVSSKVLNAALAEGRDDCIAVNDTIRDKDGRPVGCKGFRVDG